MNEWLRIINSFCEDCDALKDDLKEWAKELEDRWRTFSEIILGGSVWPYTGPEPKTPVEYARKLCGRIDIHRKEPVERVYKVRRNLPYQRRRF